MAGGESVELVEVEMEDIEGVVVDCERLFVCDWGIGGILGWTCGSCVSDRQRAASICERDTWVRVVWDKNGGKL